MKHNKRHTNQHTEAVIACEKYLHEQKEYNISHRILFSENMVINRLLSRQLELLKFYNEIYDDLEPTQWKIVISIILYTAAFWNPEAAETTRNAKKELINLNANIENLARNLAKLLHARYELSEKHGLHSYDKYHIADLIEDASENNSLYESYLKQPLRRLATQFDLRYWPSLSEVIGEIASDAQLSEVHATDPITHANIDSTRNSLTDYFKAFFQALDNERTSANQPIPDEFKLSDDSLAAVANCALDLPEDMTKDGLYVKRLRQRIHE